MYLSTFRSDIIFWPAHARAGVTSLEAHHLWFSRWHIGPLASYLLLEGTGFAHSGVDNTSISSDWPDLQFLFYPLHLATDGGLLFRIILGMSEKVGLPTAQVCIQYIGLFRNSIMSCW